MKRELKEKLPYLFMVASVASPLLLYAQVGSLEDVAGILLAIFDTLIGVVITAALLFFLYGVGKYIISYDDEQARTESKKFMLWGIIALFVMVSVWALVNIVIETFGFTTDTVDLRPPHSSAPLVPIDLSIFNRF